MLNRDEDILKAAEDWQKAGHGVALATVVETWGSAPRPAGSSLVINDDGTFLGSVSGGCVEGAVYELGQEVVGTGEPVLQRYGVSDEDAFSVGLTCGGILDVFVEKVNRETFPELGDIAGEYLRKGRQVYIEGRLEYGSYEKDGVKHYTTDIIADEMQMLGGGERGDYAGGDRPQRQAPAQRREPQSRAAQPESQLQPQPFADDFADDDIPF